MRSDVLPSEFSLIANLVSYVVKRTANEWSGSCPKCGGVPHQNGELPDRFRMFRVSKYGKPLGWCRSCDWKWTADKGRKPSVEEIELWRAEQIKIESERKEAAERALELLQNERLWEIFYTQNIDYSMRLFRDWGMTESWIKYLQWGLIPDYEVKSRKDGNWEYYHSPAASLPVWGVGAVVQNIQLRVLNPRNEGDRYRNYYKTGGSYLFVPLYDLPLTGTALIVEGLKKAAVVEQKLDDIGIRVVGVQSKKPDPRVLDELKDCDPIYIGLDPDAFVCGDKSGESAVQYISRIIGKERARIIQFPCKPDDGINEYGLEPMKFINMAKKA